MSVYADQKMNENFIHIDGITIHQGGPYVYIATASKIDEMNVKKSQLFPELISYVNRNKLKKRGKEFTLYKSFNEKENTTIFAVGVPIKNIVSLPPANSILCDTLPRHKVIKTTLKGDYKYLEKAYDSTYAYIANKNLVPREESAILEVYVTNKDDDPNPATWLTELYIPIE